MGLLSLLIIKTRDYLHVYSSVISICPYDMTLGMKMVEVPRKDLGYLTSCKCVSHVSARLLKQNKKIEKSKRIHIYTSHKI